MEGRDGRGVRVPCKRTWLLLSVLRADMTNVDVEQSLCGDTCEERLWSFSAGLPSLDVAYNLSSPSPPRAVADLIS